MVCLRVFFCSIVPVGARKIVFHNLLSLILVLSLVCEKGKRLSRRRRIIQVFFWVIAFYLVYVDEDD